MVRFESIPCFLCLLLLDPHFKMSRPDIDKLVDEIYTEKSASEKLKSNPAFTIGLIGAGIIFLYQVRDFKNRGKLRISDYVIHTRMYTQGFFVLALTAGIGYNMAKHLKSKYYDSPAEITPATDTDNSSK